MSVPDLEQTLKDLPRLGALVKDRPYRQVWRFEAGGKGYYLKFYPRRGGKLKRMVRGNPAMREFLRLQWLQKAGVPSPRAVAVLSGFVIDQVKGDATIAEAIEPATQVDRYLNAFELQGRRAPDHRALAQKIRELLVKLAAAKLGHDDLHLGNFLRDEKGEVFLLDAYAVTLGGLKMKQIMRLGHSVARYATRQDIRRGFAMLAPNSDLPKWNDLSASIWKKSARRICGGNRYFGKLKIGEWAGACFKHWKGPHRFSPASRLEISPKDWEREWPLLLQKIEGGLLEMLKTSASGDVSAGEVTLAGRTIEVVIKQARRKKWYRYINEIGRGSRSWRAWKKAWNLLIRGIPTAWPLAIMERRFMGYVVEQAIIFERVPGKTLAKTNLDIIETSQRDQMFRRCGRMLRRIETVGFSHFDSKSSNWIIMPDEARGPTPVLVDVDGVRFYRWDTFGIQRLLRSMKEHRQYSRADSQSLCEGYAPFSRMEEEL